MSYSKSTKMHCKVCESAKKPISIVSSHNPKNRDGFTVCPTLLSQECRYCNKKGHTTKYCSRKTKDEQDSQWVLQQEEKYKNEKANKKVAKLLLKSFDALYESSDDENEHEHEPKEVAPKEESKRYMEAVMKAPPLKKEQKPKEIKIKVKIDWANADSDSEGDESESDM